MNLDLNLGSYVHPPDNDPPHTMTLDDLLRMGPDPSNHHHRSLKTNENGNEGSFFDCNICLDLATDPVVTCCGHLFCWPCIYRWLFVHSNAKQCPICKGEVTTKTITPIYGRVNRINRVNSISHTHVAKVDDPNGLKIPNRPEANRVESWRHVFQRDTLNSPIIEMVRRLDNNRFHLSRDPLSSTEELSSTHLLNRIFTSRGIRGRDPVRAASPDGTLDLPDDGVPNLTSVESFLDSYNRDHPDESHSMSGVGYVVPSEGGRALDLDIGSSRLRRRRLQ